MKPELRRLAPLCLAVSIAAACSETEPSAPADFEPASVALAFEFAASSGSAAGLQEAYLKTNRLWLQFRDGTSSRDERQVEFQPGLQETSVPLLLRLRSPRESLQFNIEVRLGDAGVFRGTAPVTLRSGRLTTVRTTLLPILAGVRAPDTVPVLTSWGDTIALAAAGILATGDTILGVATRWTALDPAVASIDSAGTVVSRSNGVARMVAIADAFRDTAVVRVQANVARIVITPAGGSIPLRGTRQFTAAFFDGRGNMIPPQPVTWSSANPGAVAISTSGLATGTGIGSALIRATAGTISATTDVETLPIPPQTDSLKATVSGTSTAMLTALVIPNGATTQSQFEWGSKQVAIPPSFVLPLAVGSGLLPVPIATTLTGLRPNTLYFAVVRAANSAGSTLSDTIWFTTGGPNSGSGAPSVTTEGWTPLQPGWVVLIGSVDAWGGAADAWFEWGATPALGTVTPVQAVSGSGRQTVTAPIQLPTPGTTYYFRFVARNASGTSKGAVLSLTVGTLKEPTASTGPATNVTFDGATLNGTVNPNGLPSTAWFDWGTSPSLATFASSPAQAIGGGFTTVGFSFTLIALSPNTTYYFRVNASNSVGTGTGPILSFTTPPDPNVTPAAVSTLAPTYIFESQITLNGSANPNGSPTTVWFEWGPTATLSSFTATAEQAIGGGASPVAFSAALPAGTSGYYRAVAKNGAGTVYGAIVAY